jgi:hypothetical protein
VGRELIAMRVGMGIVPGGKDRFVLGVVGWVGMGVDHGVDTVIFFVPLFVLPG